MRAFGWRKQPDDPRDRVHARQGLVRTSERRLDTLIGHVRDQGNTSSCVGHACVAALELLYAVAGRPIAPRSPDHAYYVAREVDGFQREDGGAYIRSCFKAGRRVGFCSEARLPLRSAEHINERPPQEAENEGIVLADFAYERITGGTEAVLDALQSGHPVVMGANVTSTFVACSSSATIPAPKQGDVRRGGHAFLLCGYDGFGARIRMLNSWSRGWGDDGFAWLDPRWCSESEASDVIALVATPEAA